MSVNSNGKCLKNKEKQRRILIKSRAKATTKGSVIIDRFDGIVYQQSVNRKENLNGKGIGYPVNVRKFLLEKQFEIVRVVGLENPFNSASEILETIGVSEMNMLKKTELRRMQLEEEHQPDIRMVNNDKVLEEFDNNNANDKSGVIKICKTNNDERSLDGPSSNSEAKRLQVGDVVESSIENRSDIPKVHRPCDGNPMLVLNTLDQMKKREFYNYLYLDHMIECNGLEHLLFGNQIEIYKLGRLDLRVW
ncbi:42871_t:CDS:2 [Gigaspora margarita]|uniref:42871_t:CDS:1 n=1 Tax=Gigaspora margarita TaxID=4874 RepID=A0ABN7US12_GIGMA|nr:42871_t:CDS:2 [Gigaspora margarita]